MQEYKNKKLKSKTLLLFFLIILIIINCGILFSYYYFYLSDQMVGDLTKAKNENYKNIYIIAKSIENKSLNESISIVKNYISENGGYVTLKDFNGNIVYTNNKPGVKLFSSTIIIYIDSIEYEITYSKISVLPGMKIIRGFILYEIVFVCISCVIAFYFSSKKYIDPIDTITMDINNYKFGKIPFKRKMPKKMQKIQNTFVDMVNTLEIEKDYQNQIIASISHDIKTPLTSVIGYADRLKKNELSDTKRLKYIDKIYNKSLLIKDILEEFDDYQSCNIKETMKFDKVSIKHLCGIIKNDFEEELFDKNITIKINNISNDYMILIDIIKIKRVFSNIITNSVRHFNKNKGLIIVNISSKENKVYFEIADNAGGIKDENAINKIFEPFYTTDLSRKISGLGLSICKKIITAHEGGIFAKNNNIGGLSIIFVLPVLKS